MVILDRVVCSRCSAPLGQLWNQPASAPDLLSQVVDHFCPGGCSPRELESRRIVGGRRVLVR